MATSPMLPAIPLFTLAGYILAAGGSSQRLLALFSAVVGWLPGGLAIVVTLLLAFFTPLTGASGITILAMGGLLLPMLVRAATEIPRSASSGVGSIGVLPPACGDPPAYYAELQLNHLFLGGLLPGLCSSSWWRPGAVAWLAQGRRAPPFQLRGLRRRCGWPGQWPALSFSPASSSGDPGRGGGADRRLRWW
jgi:TRAP-type C4-dicarboxylate transport system permease large subunit